MPAFRINDYRTSSKVYTHQSLSGGKFDIPEDKQRDLFKYILKNPSCSLCEKLPEKFPLYFDLDGLNTNYDIKTVVSDISKNINEFFECKELDDPIILVNKSKDRNFHIYYTDVVVEKQTAREFCKLVNVSTFNNDEVLDPQTYNSCFRMYGTNKFDRRKGGILKDTCYVLYDNTDEGVNDIEVMKKVSIRGYGDKDLSIVIGGLQTSLTTKKTKKVHNFMEVDLKDEDEEDTFVPKNKYYLEELSRNDFEIARYILFQCFSSDRVNSREDWLKAGFMCKNLQIPKLIFLEWSKTSTHYKAGDNWVEDQINQIYSSKSEDGREVGLRSFLFWARSDNRVKFNKIKWGVSLFEYVENSFPIEMIEKYFNLGDRGDAILFSKIFKDRIVCTNILNSRYTFHLWNGNIWEEDTCGFIKLLICEKLCRIYTSLLTHYKSKIARGEDIDESQDMVKLIRFRLNKCNTHCYSKNILPFVAYYFHDKNIREKFNSNRDLLSVKNGVIELSTGKFRYRTYDDYMTFFIETEYKGLKEDTSGVEAFFKDLMLDRVHLVKYLQKFLGYSITGHVSAQKFSILHGCGSNGKSLSLQLLTELLEDGKYITSLSGDALSSRFKNGAATTQWNCLEGARLAFLDESDKNQELNEGVIKRVTGGSKLKIRKLYQEEHSINIQAQLFLITNHKPKISNDYAFHRRLVLYPFEAHFVDADKFDKNDKTHKLKKCEEDLKSQISMRKGKKQGRPFIWLQTMKKWEAAFW